MSTVEFSEIPPAIDKDNVTCREVLRVIDTYSIPLSRELRADLQLPDGQEYNQGKNRYGAPFAVASGRILRHAAMYGVDSNEAYTHIFGVDPASVWDDIVDYVERNAQTSDSTDQQQLIINEWAEASEDPRIFYSLHLLQTTPAFHTEGAALMWRLLRSSVYGGNTASYSFDCTPTKGLVWGNCKDSEAYLLRTLDGSKYRQNNGAHACIYVDTDNEPVFYQKIGGYAIKVDEHFSNATALTLKEVTVNGIVLPVGTLVGIEGSLSRKDLQSEEDRIMSVDSIQSVLPLRLTVFSLSPDAARVSFGGQYEELVQNDFGEGTITIDSFQQTARNICKSKRV